LGAFPKHGGKTLTGKGCRKVVKNEKALYKVKYR
jgi:hypothetical protein